VSDVPPDQRFARLTYEAFQRMAGDPSLSPHERSGFPDEYREGAEDAILADVEAKLPALAERGATVIDLGCGAGPLAEELRRRCAERGQQLVLVDSPEVLAHHADGPGVAKVPGRFPESIDQLVERVGGCDAVLAYSVLQYAFAEASAFTFVDAALTLLRPGGRLLVGDVPNSSMRRRFLASEAGRAHHREYTGRDEDPPVGWPALPAGEIDDAVVLALATRARDAGYHAWILPQAAGLPMANRREDLLFARP
jgi:2-polyprenyl-3-methyl-5-hydroxy-6-metoxy-1,4-benzoquinol methylase